MERQEALMEELVLNTKVIMDAMDLFTQGGIFPEGLGDGETGRAGGGKSWW